MDIKLIQETLNRQGYGPIAEDDHLGPLTFTAIRKFQSANNLTPDGIIGAITLKALNLPAPVIPLKGKYDVQPFPKNSSLSLRELSLQIALSQEGVRELTGKNDGPAVETYLKSIGLGRGYSWCMAFMYWATEQACIIKGMDNPLIKTGGVLNQWYHTKCKKIMYAPQRGDIFIIDHGAGLGHCGRVVDVYGNIIKTIEGNGNTNGSREGLSVVSIERSTSNIKGYIRI